MRRILLLTAVASLLGTLSPAAAPAQLSDLYEEYLGSGVIAGCAHSQGELETALKEIPADIRAYDPDFATALRVALEQRAAGCAEAEQFAQDVLIPTLFGTSEAEDGSPGPAVAAVSAIAPPAPPAAPEPGSGKWVGLLFAALALLAVALVLALRGGGHRGSGGRLSTLASDVGFVVRSRLRR